MIRRAAAIAILAAVIHAPALDAGFVSDDSEYVLGNPALRSWRTLPDVFVESSHQHLGFAGHYRPVAAASWGLDLLTWGGARGGQVRAWPLHATSILAHAAACVALLLLLERHLGPALAMPAALLYAVHPVHVEAVAWLSGRSEVLATLFDLLALLALGIERRAVRLPAVALCAWLAFGSKETAFLLPAMAAALCACGRFPRGRPWDGVLVSSLLLTAFLAVRTVLLEASPPIAYLFPGATWPFRCRMALSVAAAYLKLLAWPWPLTVEYYWPGDVPPASWAVTGGAILIGVLALAARRSTRAIGAALLATLFLLTPVLHLNKLAETMAERVLYAPSAPFCIAVALVLEALRRRSRLVGQTLLAGLVLAGASISASQCTVWRDEVSLWENAVRHAPASPFARDALASAYQRAGRLDLALPQWQILWRSGQASDAVRHNLAVAYQRAGRPRDALEALGPDRVFPPRSEERLLQEELRQELRGESDHAPGRVR